MMKRTNQKGSALILAMILVLVLSVMAASMMFLSQSETWASMNYRLMTQARYGAEAGLNVAANYLMYTYQKPGISTDPLSAYDMTKSPVTLAGTNTPVFLSTYSGVTANYPVSAVRSDFASKATGPLQAGTTPLTYDSSAQLLSMRQISVYGSSTPATVQTWKLTGRGGIANVSNASVEVSAIMEQIVSPMFAYAAFATSNGCSAITFSGHNATTNSYNSGSLVANGGTATNPVFANSSGNIGSNGNTDLSSGNPTIHGSLSTPRTGVGTCSAGNTTALTGATSQVTGGIVELPQAVTYPIPPAPNPMPTNTTYNPGATLTPTIAPNGTVGVAYGNITLNGNQTLTLTAGTYNVNTISVSANAKLIIDASAGPVIMNIAGLPCDLGTSTTPPSACSSTVGDFGGKGISNPSLNPANFQIQYAGAGTISLAGTPQSAALVDAPYATGSIVGTSDFFGAMIVNKVTDLGTAAIHYDTRLQNEYFFVGNWMLDSFSWSKY